MTNEVLKYGSLGDAPGDGGVAVGAYFQSKSPGHTKNGIVGKRASSSPHVWPKVSVFERFLNKGEAQNMNTKPIDALKSLSELALTAPGLEPLVVYDSVATLASKLAEDVSDPAHRDMASAAERATATARAVRDADRQQVDFLNFLKPGGAAV